MINIDVKGTRGVLSGAIDGNVWDVIAEMPDYKRIYDGKLFFALVSSNINVIRRRLPDAMWSEEAESHVRKIEEIAKQAEQIKIAKEAAIPEEAFFFDFKTKPYDHQRKAFFISRDKPVFGWFMEMGTGKTKVAIDNIAYLDAQGEIELAVVIAPNGVHEQWIEEQLPIHAPDWMPYDGFTYKSSMGIKKKKEISDSLGNKNKLTILAINIEALSSKKGQDFLFNAVASNKTLIAVDESTKIKNYSAGRTKALIKIGEMAKFKRIMSGSPITRSVEDLYTQFAFLDKNLLGFTSFYAFKNRYCQEIERMNMQTGKPYKQVVGYKNLDELIEKVSGFTFRVTKEECLDLPEKVYQKRYVPMTKEQSAAYKSLTDNFWMQTEQGKIITAAIALTRLMRLQRILCGHIEDEDNNVSRIASNRGTLCIDTINELQSKTIVWCRFKEDIKILTELMDAEGIKYVHYYGGDKESLDKFKNDPDIKVFLSNPKSGGIGLNITEAKNMIYYSNDFDAESRWQSEARAHRAGQTNRVTVIDLVCPHTVDEKIIDALKNKKRIADIVIDDANNTKKA